LNYLSLCFLFGLSIIIIIVQHAHPLLILEYLHAFQLYLGVFFSIDC